MKEFTKPRLSEDDKTLLAKTQLIIDKVYEKISFDVKLNGCISSDEKKISYHNLILNQLYLIGNRTMMLDDLYRDKMRDYYTITYKKSPSMGRKLFWKTFLDMHKPYDILKKRCWKMLEIINMN